MSASPDSPLHSLFTGLTTDQVIAEEQGYQTTQPPVRSILGKRTPPLGDKESDDEDDGESPNPGEGNPHSRPSSVNPASLQMEQVVRRMAKRFKFSNESISLVEQFSQVHATKP